MKFNLLDFEVGVIEQPHPNIFRFPLFRRSLCETLLSRASQSPSEAPNSMNKYGKDCSEMGLDSWLERVMKKFVAPIARDYYPEAGQLKRPYGFIVDYRMSTQRKLDQHIDEPSAVTLNVCLGRFFTGGALRFFGPRQEEHVIEHTVGQAIIHRGHHLHQAGAITSGHRSNLILWCGAKKPNARR